MERINTGRAAAGVGLRQRLRLCPPSWAAARPAYLQAAARAASRRLPPDWAAGPQSDALLGRWDCICKALLHINKLQSGL